LVDALRARGDKVLVLDDLSTGSMANLNGFQESWFTLGSCANVPLLNRLVQQADGVFHLASPVGVKLIMTTPGRALCDMVRHDSGVIQVCANHKKPLLVTSSSEVYGAGSNKPMRENNSVVLGPPTCHRWCYAAGKYAMECQAIAAHRHQGLPVMVARLFNTAGPRQSGDHGMVIPRFVRAALAGEPLGIYGNGSQTRCFCHVQDTVRALLSLIDCEAARGMVVNVGDDSEHTIHHVARRICQLSASKSPMKSRSPKDVFGPGFTECRRRVPELGQIHRLIHWRPARTLDDILRDVIEHERQRQT
jgi:UDP-glucose 4-epimerase